jgi:hypothetical protein
MTRHRRAAVPGALVLALLAVGCAPKNEVNIGLKDYATDVVYGEPTSSTTAPPPPTPGASLSPGFPAFLTPAPPPAPLPGAPVTVPPRAIEIVEDPCPIAGPGAQTIKAGPQLVGTPSVGAYTFRQEGTSTVGGVATKLPDLGQRTVKNANNVGGTPTWDIDVVEFGVTTTTSYRTYRPGGGTADGLYITRIVQQAPGHAPDEFAPLDPGLRLLPEPTTAGAQWTSVATDAIHGVSMILQGTVKEARRVDVCGVLVEGWAADVSVSIRRPGIAASDDYTTTATYVVASGLGGLIIADSVKSVGTVAGVALDRQSSSVLDDLASH